MPLKCFQLQDTQELGNFWIKIIQAIKSFKSQHIKTLARLFKLSQDTQVIVKILTETLLVFKQVQDNKPVIHTY